MLCTSIKSVFVDVFIDSSYYGITINVYYYSGRSSRYAFSNWAYDRLPITAMLSSVPASVSKFIDDCAMHQYYDLVPCSEHGYYYAFGSMFAAAHA